MRQRAPSGLKALPGFNPRICKRCDDFKYILKMRNRGFNPRICKRCDVNTHIGEVSNIKVSIHASVKDATISIQKIERSKSFNPRICKRCDLISINIAKIINSFNPRICKRCDYETKTINDAGHVSIHASVKDAT